MNFTCVKMPGPCIEVHIVEVTFDKKIDQASLQLISYHW